LANLGTRSPPTTSSSFCPKGVPMHTVIVYAWVIAYRAAWTALGQPE